MKVKEDVEKLRSKETMSRASSARQAISSMSDTQVDTTVEQQQQQKHPAKKVEQPEEAEGETAGARSEHPLPLMEASTIGIVGKWKEKYGNYVILPDADSTYNKGNEAGVLNASWCGPFPRRGLRGCCAPPHLQVLAGRLG